MTKDEIIGELARTKAVERIVKNVCPGVTGAEQRDLCQIVYLALLDKDDARIEEARRDGWLTHLIAAIARRQVNGNRTDFRRLRSHGIAEHVGDRFEIPVPDEDETPASVADDYRFDESPFCPDAREVRELKRVLDTEIDFADREVIIQLAESGSFAKLARKLGVSKTVVVRQVQRIRRDIFEKMRNDWENDD